MIKSRVAVHDNVVDVSDGESPLHTTQEHVHHSLENSRTRSETKGQSPALALAIKGYEAGFGEILFLNLYLVDPGAHIHNREVRFALEGGQDIVRTWQRLLRYHNVLANFPTQLMTSSP